MAYLPVISSFWGTRCPPWNTRYIFIRCITQTEARNPEFSFARFSSSAVKCWTFAPIRMNISPRDARCRARRHKSFLYLCYVALLQDVIRRLCKKVSLATVHSTPRVAANGRCYTVSRMDTVTGKLRVEKRAATQDSFFMLEYSVDSWSSNSVQNLVRCIRSQLCNKSLLL